MKNWLNKNRLSDGGGTESNLRSFLPGEIWQPGDDNLSSAFKHRNSNDSKLTISKLVQKLKGTSVTTSWQINNETEANTNTVSALKTITRSQKDSFSTKGEVVHRIPMIRENCENHGFDGESDINSYSTPKKLGSKSNMKSLSNTVSKAYSSILIFIRGRKDWLIPSHLIQRDSHICPQTNGYKSIERKRQRRQNGN